jgi:hypothetical protein
MKYKSVKQKKVKNKSNKNLSFIKDDRKSYVYVEEKGKTLGIFMWHYAEQKWVFQEVENE